MDACHGHHVAFIAGIIAKFSHPGPNEPAGFISPHTTILDIIGAVVATYLGQAAWMVSSR